jgi:uncharacterized protein DUF3631
MMFEKGITFAEAIKTFGGRNSAAKRKGKLVKTYDFVDESGKLLFQTCRFEPKDFSQRRPDATARDGWAWDLKGVRRVLYRLPEVLPAETVCIAEGEKDCDNLVELGFTATTNPMGAGKWRKEHSDTLRGKDAVVFGDVGDSNGEGEKHTAQVLASLSGIARSIKHVRLPDGFHDISDYIASLEPDKAAQTIAQLIEQTPLHEAKRAPADNSENADDEAEIARLAALSVLEYERTRKEAAKKLNCRPSILDSLIHARRLLIRPPSETDNLQGEVVNLTDVEPWPEPVNGAEILDAISHRFEHYVVLPQGAADMLSLWCAHTYTYKVFQVSPRVHASSPTHNCGKSTLRDCASLFCQRAVRTDNMSTAVMFRLVSGQSPTVLADECDKWIFPNEELLGLICSGHRKGGDVMRCEGDENELRKFRCHAPIFLAAIGTLPAQVHSRSIVVRLERATREEFKACARFDLEHVEVENELCRKLARWVADNRERIAACEPKLPENLFNRMADNWRPLFKIAEVAGGNWPQRCANALIKLTAEEDEAESLRVMLLADIRQVLTAEKIFSRDLRDLLADMDERPWPEVCRGSKPITERWLARNLAAFGIKSKNVRIDEKQAKGYERTDFDDVFAHYLEHARDVGTDTERPNNDTGTDTETEASPRKNDEWDAGTAEKPKNAPRNEFFPGGTSTL